MGSSNERHRHFHSFWENPSIRFETQREKEIVKLVLRSHPATQIPWMANAVIFIFVLIIMDWIMPNFITLKQLIFVNIFALGLIFSYTWINFLHWFYNVGILTDERAIDVDYSSITYKEVTEAKLENIEDITSKVSGYLGSFFNFGDVFVQTAGEKPNIEFIKVPEPAQVIRIIDSLINK